MAITILLTDWNLNSRFYDAGGGSYFIPAFVMIFWPSRSLYFNEPKISQK